MAEPNFLDFSDFLETQPQALYQSYLSDPKTRMTSSMKRYYQNQFANIQNEYLGKLARDMRAGNVPTDRFDDYLKSDVFLLHIHQHLILIEPSRTKRHMMISVQQVQETQIITHLRWVGLQGMTDSEERVPMHVANTDMALVARVSLHLVLAG